MYGTQARFATRNQRIPFENDVKMYGTQAVTLQIYNETQFENDVKMYGTQAMRYDTPIYFRLRMM